MGIPKIYKRIWRALKNEYYNLWTRVESWYERDTLHPAKTVQLERRSPYGAQFLVNGRWIFIPKGSLLRWPCNRKGELDRVRYTYKKEDEATKLPK